MINIKDALYNILHSRYGRDVRQSIHDGIYQINENANEAIELAQIKFGTAVNSPTDPITGYTENSLYLNVNTNIMWKLEGGLWVKKGTFKSIDNISLSSTSGTIDTYKITFTDGSVSNFNVTNGTDGADGKSITGITKTSTSGKIDHYDVNLSDGTTISGFDVTNGADGKSIANIALASTSGNVKTYDVFLDDGTKTPTGFSVEDGASSYLHIRYSSSFDGTGMVTTPTDATVYIGILVSTSSVAPTNPSYYNWVRFIGKSGTGSGDMLSTDYATKYPNTVDKAAALYDGSNEILPNQLMKKSQYDADDDGIVDESAHATNADKVGNADTSVLERFGGDNIIPTYNGNNILLDISLPVTQYKTDEFKITNYGLHQKELSLHSNITKKLSKLNSDGTLNFSNVKNTPTTLSGYGITDVYTKTEVDNKLDSWHKYNGAIEEITANYINTDEEAVFRNVDTSKAYELWFDTSDGKQATVKSSELLLQADGTYNLKYVVNTPTAQTKFRLLVKGIN